MIQKLFKGYQKKMWFSSEIQTFMKGIHVTYLNRNLYNPFFR